MTDRLSGDGKQIDNTSNVPPGKELEHFDEKDELATTQEGVSGSESIRRLDDSLEDTSDYVHPEESIEELENALEETLPAPNLDIFDSMDSQPLDQPPAAPDVGEQTDDEPLKPSENGNGGKHNNQDDTTSEQSTEQKSDDLPASPPPNDDSTTPEEPVGTPLSSLHVIHYIHWDRGGSETLEHQRAILLDQVEDIVNAVDEHKESKGKLILGGQNVILEDISSLRPDMRDRIAEMAKQGHLEIGVWYVFVDEILVSGESIIRNLLEARRSNRRFDINAPTSAYMPGHGGHVYQLPQILADFDVDSAFLYHGAPIVDLPFIWEAPDGSRVLIVSTTTNPDVDLNTSLDSQKIINPDGPYLWLTQPSETVELSGEDAELPVTTSSLGEFVTMVRQGMGDSQRPTLKGELRMQSQRSGSYLLPGTLSARMPLKQKNAYLQNLLTYHAEPLVTLATTANTLEHGRNVLAMLSSIWRNLLKTQARSSLGGYSLDQTHHRNEIRNAQIESGLTEVIGRALDALPGVLHNQQSILLNKQTDLHIVVWNGLGWDTRAYTKLELELPPNKFPATLVDAKGMKQDYVWLPDEKAIEFIADVPACGYTTYTLNLSEEQPDEERRVSQYNATHITASDGATLLIENMRVTWRQFAKGIDVADMLRFFDGGDAGDIFNYDPPTKDIVEQGTLAGTVEVQESAIYKRLLFRHRMRVAGELKPDGVRERGLRLLDLHTTATVYQDIPGIYFRTTFTNTANDHRLRAHIKTGVHADIVYSDSPFGLIPHKIVDIPFKKTSKKNTESLVTTLPMQSVCAVENIEGGIAVVTRGLPEFEAIAEKDQITLALTLVRSVGWLSKDNLRSRNGTIVPVQEAPEAQCQQDMVAEYAFVPYDSGDHSQLNKISMNFNAGPIAYQYDAPPAVERHSYLRITETDGAVSPLVMTALKPPEQDEGWIVRVVNPENKLSTAHIKPSTRPTQVARVSMAEKFEEALTITDDGAVELEIYPHQIITLHFKFG